MSLACELLAWTQMLALTGPARRWGPKRLRLRLVLGCRVPGPGRPALRLRLAQRWPVPDLVTAAVSRLQTLPSG